MITQQYVSKLALRVANGEQGAFEELEGIAKPLLKSLAHRFSSYHHKFEFDDFYSIGLQALYKAATSYNPRNPSFLDYAKTIMLRDYWREMEYWNADKRNIFSNDLSLDRMEEDGICDADIMYPDTLAETANSDQFCERISDLVDDCFDEDKAVIMKAFLLYDRRVSEIARETGMKYKNVHSIVARGLDKLRKEYSSRFLDGSIVL